MTTTRSNREDQAFTTGPAWNRKAWTVLTDNGDTITAYRITETWSWGITHTGLETATFPATVLN